LAPLMGMVPVKRWPPTMRMRSIALLSLGELPSLARLRPFALASETKASCETPVTALSQLLVI
jgi:hypothetical protein